MNCVLSDFESTKDGIIHTISFISMNTTVTKKWISHGRHREPEFRTNKYVTRGPLQTIFIKESLGNENITDDPRNITKFGKTVVHGETVHVLPFRNAVELFSQYVMEYGDGNWLAHSIDNDLDFLWKTDLYFKTGLFPKPLRHYPHYCPSIPYWPIIVKVCTQQLLSYKCPEFIEKYKSWATMNGWLSPLPEFSCTLQSLSQFVKDDRDYKVQHIAPTDVLDLFDVLKVSDFKLDGESFIVSKPRSTWNDTQTKTSSVLLQ